MSPRRLTVPATRGAGPARGFTLIELLVTITIAAILLALVAPSFDDASASSKVSDIATRLAVSANTARGEAIKRNGKAVMCMSADGATCAASGGWEQGWIVFHDRNQNGARDANADPALDDTIVLRESGIATGFKAIERDAKTSVIFPATSVGTTEVLYTVCRVTPSIAKQKRYVRVSPTGKGSVQREAPADAAACA
jgi:type IV fimbrial biogenesis protein FimT